MAYTFLRLVQIPSIPCGIECDSGYEDDDVVYKLIPILKNKVMAYKKRKKIFFPIEEKISNLEKSKKGIEFLSEAVEKM